MGIFTLKLDNNRKFGLDILRALAILFVIIEHGSVLLPKKLMAVSEFFIFDGVSIFFVLSGFLIGGIIIKMFEDNDRMNFKLMSNFWARRWYRTLPNYYLILAILTFLNYFFIADFKLWKVKRYIFFSQNLIHSHPSFFGEAWSLSVEEWFYLIIPVLIALFLWLFRIKPSKAVVLVAVLTIFSVTAFRYYRHLNIDVSSLKIWDLFFRKQVFTRLDSLMYGVIGAYLHYYAFDKWIKFKNLLLVVGILMFLFSKFYYPNINGVYFKVFYFSIISLATLFTLPFLSVLKIKAGIFYKPISYLSLISYSMYLLNLNVIQIWIINRIDWNIFLSNDFLISIIKYIVFWILVILLSILLYKYFELPMMKLRDKKTRNEL
ncbi:acyltransferase [uncultured Flavobacterium sp.]|uniref:acyltransferase family protein n=1 Tax=uncultured Flavobacterium sp. TaxID=165435 RepID=UPI0030EE2BC9|tara:strand:- start:18659 stop:19786 length:1128 start_codon:yes stop_codon:yes gene_type:complete